MNDDRNELGQFKPGWVGGPGRTPGSLTQGQIDARRLTAVLMRACVDVTAMVDLKQLLKEAAEKDILRWWAMLGKYLPSIEQFLSDAVPGGKGVTKEDIVSILNKIERERQQEAKRVGAEVIE